MADVLAVPHQLDRYYRSSSPRCRSPQGSYTPPYEESSIPRAPLNSFNPFPPTAHKLSPPSSQSSPELSSLVYSTQSSSPLSSVSSSICLDSKPESDADSRFFPVYDFGVLSPSPSPEPSESPLAGDYDDADDDDDGHDGHGNDGGEEDTECPSPQSPPEADSPPAVVVPVLRPSRSEAADDTCVRHEPSRHVDYLSHDWKEEDIWASWRYMVGKRKVHSNAARLENASWRTWAKKKYQLRTVSANKLNWMKDCDVTWLYGPLSVGAENFSARPPPSPLASPVEAVKIPSCKTKPILKKRSMSEIMLQKSLSTSSLLKQATAVIESQQSGHLCPRPVLVARANSDFSLAHHSKASPNVSVSSPASDFSTGCQSPAVKKHIHFNDRVQQCIAVETDDDHHYAHYHDRDRDRDHDDDRNHHDDDDDDDDSGYGRAYDADDSLSDNGIVMVNNNGNGSSKRGSDRGSSSEPQTIAHLPSTTLKYKDEPAKRKGSILSVNSLFATPKPAPPAPAERPPANPPPIGTNSYVLEDDDDMAGLDWEPNSSSGFSARRDARTLCSGNDSGNSTLENSSDFDDFQLPNFNSWDDDDPAAAGLFGRAVDAVNTARDIAHVLWNVGWRR